MTGIQQQERDLQGYSTPLTRRKRGTGYNPGGQPAQRTYLLQHAQNPVEWYPWGEEALARAKAEDKPILLSIGYSACHWCHVMAHECFENVEIAALMNQDFINVKVDREERPDLDEIYQKAAQVFLGRGGCCRIGNCQG